jgi:hypothetical protein
VVGYYLAVIGVVYIYLHRLELVDWAWVSVAVDVDWPPKNFVLIQV